MKFNSGWVISVLALGGLIYSQAVGAEISPTIWIASILCMFVAPILAPTHEIFSHKVASTSTEDKK